MSHLLDPLALKSLYYQRDHAGNQIRPKTLFLEGQPGIGKTAVVDNEFPIILSELFAEKFGYLSFVVPEHESQDMSGFLIPTKNAKGKAISVYAHPPTMPDEEYFAAHPRGIAFVDEANQGDMSMSKRLSAFFLNGRMGAVQMPVGWWVIAASNRLKDRSGVIRMPMHNVNRIRILQIQADKASLLKFYEDTQMHPLGCAFLEQFPGIVISDEMPSDPVPFCTPRSFESAMVFLREYAGVDEHGHINMQIPNNTITMEAIAGDVGQGVAAKMMAYFKNADELPKFSEILKSPTTAKVPTMDKLSAAYAAMIMCVQNTTSANVDTVWQYAERLPKALQTSAAKQLLKKTGGTLLNSKRLGAWVAANQALIHNTLKNT